MGGLISSLNLYPFMYRGENKGEGSPDDFTNAGTYLISGNSNFPFNFGTLVVYVAGFHVVQVMYPHKGSGQKHRSNWNKEGWSEWT